MISSRRFPLTWQILAVVNIPLAVGLAILLATDYRRDMRNGIVERQSRLNEEAMMIHRGLDYLGENDSFATIQGYISSVSDQPMQPAPTGHHVVVRWRGGLIYGRTEEKPSQELAVAIENIERAVGAQNAITEPRFVVGRFSAHGVTVYVTELIDGIQRSTRRHVLLHLASLLLLAVLAAVIVNVALWRIVGRPIKRLAKSLNGMALGKLTVPYQQFRCRELDELSLVVHAMSKTLATNEETHRSQMARARHIQQNLLPKNVEIPGCNFFRIFKPAEDVSGDYYDVVQLSDETWLICVADVTGHGIPAAIGAAVLKTLLLDAAAQCTTPSTILGHVNSRLPTLLPDRFISMFVAKWDPWSSVLCYASAGHEPGLMLGASSSVGNLPATGPLLGVSELAEWESCRVSLTPGDRVLLMTDGVVEACSPSNDLFGRETLSNLVANHGDLSGVELTSAIDGAVAEFQQGRRPTDDLTLVLLEVADISSPRPATNSSESLLRQPACSLRDD